MGKFIYPDHQILPDFINTPVYTTLTEVLLTTAIAFFDAGRFKVTGRDWNFEATCPADSGDISPIICSPALIIQVLRHLTHRQFPLPQIHPALMIL